MKTHASKHGIKPTWPHSANQRKQSRPVITLRPIRRLRKLFLESNPPNDEGVRVLTLTQRQTIARLRNAPRPQIERAIAEAA